MKFIITLFFLTPLLAFAAKPTYGPYQAEVIKVKDGDTVLVDVAVWPGLTQRVSIRLVGVNTPEKRGKGITDCEKRAGQKATEFTQRWLKDAGVVTVSDVKLGKYAGRALGKISKKGQDLGEALIASGHAKPYSGGKREPWCL
jgi:endonuclease YncB( thermonuclease family)